MADLKSLLDPISQLVATLELSDPDGAERALSESFPEDGDVVRDIETAARAGIEEGTICHKESGGIRFSRIAKPGDDPVGCSIDAVYMSDSPGPFHVHLKGEVCLCFPDTDSARFEGRSATWMVLPPMSRHAPQVEGGSMLILYWWPEGAVAWE